MDYIFDNIYDYYDDILYLRDKDTTVKKTKY